MYTAQGKMDKSHVLEEHLPLVRRIAMQMISRLPASVEVDDLIQAGRIGLLDAWKRFEEGAAASFETFASQRIRGAMLDELRAMDWVPRRIRRSSRQVEDAIQAAAHAAGRVPTETEVAAQMAMALPEYRELLMEIQGAQLVYAEDLRKEDSDGSVFDDAGDTRDSGSEQQDPLERLLSVEFRSRLVAAIRELPEREAQVLSLHYDEELTLREIASVLEVTASRASQLHNQAIVRLRAMLRECIGA